MILAPYAKAVTALVVTFLTGWFTNIGVDLDATQAEVFTTIVGSLITAFFVWAVPNTPRPNDD